jgi:protein-tyrosine-phosphatase
VSAAPDIAEPEAHPAADLFPMLDDAELRPLIENIRTKGFDPGKPILRYRGQILDGRNRLRASAFAGVEPVFHDLPDDCDPYQESWRHNGLRRDLTPGQKAAILAKITAASLEWQNERDERIRKANEARAEKAKEQIASQERARDGRLQPGRSSFEDRPRERRPDNRSVTVLAEKAGVSRPTMERALKLQKEDPEKLEAVIRGDKPARKKPKPRVDHGARKIEILRLHNEGHTGAEIARRTGIPASVVSKLKVEMGIAETSAPLKLWNDIDHIATMLEGASMQIEQLASQLVEAEHLTADEQEIRKCIKSLSKSAQTVSRLRNALKQRLQ